MDNNKTSSEFNFTGQPSEACPTFFRIHCGQTCDPESVSDAAFELCRHLHKQFYCDLEIVAEEFSAIFCNDEESDELMLKWFDHYLPRIMDLVPSDERRKFIDGVDIAIQNGVCSFI